MDAEDASRESSLGASLEAGDVFGRRPRGASDAPRDASVFSLEPARRASADASREASEAKDDGEVTRTRHSVCTQTRRCLNPTTPSAADLEVATTRG